MTEQKRVMIYHINDGHINNFFLFPYLFTALQDMLAHPDLTIEIGVSAMRLAAQHDHQDLALSALQILKQKLKSPSDQQSLQRLHLVRMN